MASATYPLNGFPVARSAWAEAIVHAEGFVGGPTGDISQICSISVRLERQISDSDGPATYNTALVIPSCDDLAGDQETRMQLAGRPALQALIGALIALDNDPIALALLAGNDGYVTVSPVEENAQAGAAPRAHNGNRRIRGQRR